MLNPTSKVRHNMLSREQAVNYIRSLEHGLTLSCITKNASRELEHNVKHIMNGTVHLHRDYRAALINTLRGVAVRIDADPETVFSPATRVLIV